MIIPATGISIILTKNGFPKFHWEVMRVLRLSKKILFVLLMTVSVVTFINVLVMYWFPINIPISSFTAVRLTVVAFIEKRYYLILFSILICVLLLLSALSVRRQYVVLPSLSLLYMIYDFIVVMSLLVNGLDDGYWRTYIIRIIISIALIVLLCIYCWNGLRNHLHSQH